MTQQLHHGVVGYEDYIRPGRKLLCLPMLSQKIKQHMNCLQKTVALQIIKKIPINHNTTQPSTPAAATRN